MRGKYLSIMNENRLSDLPEPILHHIFSFLPTKEVVRSTCLLSKKWNHFSASLPYIFFNINDANLEFPCSPTLVDQFLTSRRGGSDGESVPDLHKLCLKWPACYDGRKVKDWIAMALEGNARELDIYLGLEGITWKVPAKVFAAASSVRVLRMESCICCYRCLFPRVMLFAPNLTTLELFGIKFPNGDSKGELVLSCPVLETLVVHNCYQKHLQVLNLSISRLKKLDIDTRGVCWSTHDALGDCKLELHTPNLLTFAYKGVMLKDWSIGNLEALIEVDLSLYLPSKPKESNHMNLFEGLNGARTLTLEIMYFDSMKKEELTLPLCPLNHLKYIVVWGLEGYDNELELLKYLFRSAVNLERLAITGSSSKRSKIETGDLPNFLNKLMTLSRDFPNVEVSFQIL
ncbi:hypothetical protein Syun_027260 [Stephania yunnanensis]|uniref:F-box domain-containing protein n=1 Tax=Stephania yunnanensis TaxID=152371 RepID=A0AAP0EP49_9MAGN